MEFWGVEVKAGTPLKVEVSDNNYIHLSKASLGVAKKDKGNESIPLFLNTNGQKLVIGTLSSEKIPQITYDLAFSDDFELSHNWKNGSVYFCGYKTLLNSSGSSTDSDSDSELEKALPVVTKENGKPEPKGEKLNLTAEKANVAKSKVKVEEPKKDGNLKEAEDSDDSDEDEDSDEDDGSEESESEEEPMDVSGEDSSDEEDGSADEEDGSSDEEDESSEEDTPKAEQGKKRPAGSVTKTPVPEKKAKLITPQKTGTEGKKGNVHVATPHPSKKSGKTPANNEKPKQQTPKSAGQIPCKSCSKTFTSEAALQSHTKAKHT